MNEGMVYNHLHIHFHVCCLSQVCRNYEPAIPFLIRDYWVFMCFKRISNLTFNSLSFYDSILPSNHPSVLHVAQEN